MGKTWEEVTEEIAELEKKDIYVIVSEKGAGLLEDEGELVHEQEVHSADLESIRKRVQYLKYRPFGYGNLRIARLTFIEENT